MASLRSHITVAYGLTTLASLIGLAALFGVERYNATERDLVARATRNASLAARIIERQGVQAVTLDTASGSGSAFTVSVQRLLDVVPEYVIVGDSVRSILYWSDPVRTLWAQAQSSSTVANQLREIYRTDIDTLTANAFTMRASETRIVRLRTDVVLMTALLPDPPLAGGVRRIVTAVSTQRLADAVSETASLAVLAAPVLVLVASALAWMLGGRMLAPVNQMVNDVEAITDGRSLHRRVVVDRESRDELGRLAQTVNDMVGRLETSFASLRRFTADASHELRTPLAVIRADVERAMNTPQNSHEQAVALEEALHEVSRMTGLVESLLTLARADEGRFDLIRERVPLDPLIREVAETASILGEEAGITVRLPVVEPVTVLGDAVRLRQLFLNLATNAIRYTQRGGLVEISLESRHDEAIATVRDDGIGIAAADLPFIFDRFWRVDRARSRTEGAGVGLGLAIAQWIAQAHDGRIDVSSRLGRGSTFTILLPAAPEPQPTPNSALSNS